MLSYHDSMTQNEITRHLHIDKATTTRAIQKLQRQGYVNKVQDPSDQRAFIVSLTDEGKRLIPVVKEVLKEWTDILSKNFDESDRKVAYQLLQRMVENAIEYRSNHHKEKEN